VPPPKESLMSSHAIGIDGTRLTLDGEPCFFQGLSFFNAIYNPAFNADRPMWLRRFLGSGVNALRIWCQWNFEPPRTFVGVDPDHVMYGDDGSVREEWFGRLAEILSDMDSLGMVAEVTALSHEKEKQLAVPAQERAVRELTRLLRPHRNAILQIWNEDSTEIKRHYEAAKAEDSSRLVTNSPGFSSNLGDDGQNRMLDLLTPHTVRRQDPRFWEVAPRQVQSLLELYSKPVIDDEPARDGTIKFGGIEGGTRAEWHIAQVEAVRKVGGYHIYHHDMFQNQDPDRTPAHGIPDPDFRDLHRKVFDYLAAHTRW
jgi:hypothetical protein